MTRRWTSVIGLRALIGLAALIESTTGCVNSRHAGSNDVPEALKPPKDQTLAIAAHGAGAQIYECEANKENPASFAWALKAPDAQLRYEEGKELGRHYAGPTWEAKDGSKVIGEVVARDAGPDPTAIPWLLLRATATSGNGVFSGIQWIQRLHTVGGKAPSTGCSQSYSGTQVRVDYSADYDFYAARP